MKKQEAGKKSLKWIILAAALVVVAVGVALWLTVFGGAENGTSAQNAVVTTPTEPQQEAEPEIKIYWNVDRDAYVDDNGNNLRMRYGEYYRLRFAVDGEQIDLFFENFAMVEKVDAMLFAGLVVDENNVVQQVLDVHEFTGGLTAYECYVKEVGDTEIKLNSTANFKGLDWVLRITPETQVYNVGGTGLLVGLPGKVEVGSCVYAIMDKNGYTTHIYVMPPFEEKPVYWNVERMYDATGKVTTRERDELGYFNFTFAVNGEQVKLRTMDVDVASQVDSFAAKCMHLEFNEDGTIAEAVHARVATGGNSAASWYHVLEINTNESSFYARKFSGSDKGSEASLNWANEVKIFDCSGKGAFVGEPTELRLYDQVHCLTNPYEQVTVIFVVSRPVESELYYNLDRKWDSTAKATTRVPAADGYYYIKFAVNGEHITLRTKDLSVVNTIDGRAAKVLGFDLQGDEILKAYTPGSVSGCTTTVFDYTKVTAISESGEITTTRNGKTYIAKLNENTKVFNVSSNATKVGEKTTVMVGDTVYGFTDMQGKLTYVFVTSRRNPGPLYWNLDRSYDSATKTTKRTPAADGYYYIALSTGTTTKTFKTADKSLVNTLDSYVACGITAYGDVIAKVYKYDTIGGYTGGGYASWTTVTSVNGNSFTSKDTKGTYSGYVAGKVYDVSQGSKMPVTETKLKVGDRIHAVKDDNKNIVLVFVVNRPVDVPLYYNVERLWDADAGATSREPDAEGYYVFTMAYDGQHVQVKTKDIAIANTIDGRSAKVLGLEVVDGVILKAYLPSQVAATSTTTFDYTDVTAIAEDGTITATRNGKTYTGKPAENCKIFNVSSNATLVGEVCTVDVGDKLYGFENKDGLVTYIYVVNKVAQTDTREALCTVCNETVTWKAWDGAMALTAGHWYLSEDVSVASVADIQKATTVCFDLNGHAISATVRLFNVQGTLNLCDYAGTGTVTSTATGMAPIFYVRDGATMNLYGGKLIGTDRARSAVGAVGDSASAAVNGTFNMYGGEMVGATVTGGGGVMETFHASVINIYDGTITAGFAATGSAISLSNRSTLNVLGGSIVGKTGTAASINMVGTMTVGGNAKITGGDVNVYLPADKTISVGDLGENAEVYVTMASGSGVFATDAVETDKDHFFADNGSEITFADNALSIAASAEPDPDEHEAHCVCGGVGALGDHTCETVTWQAWTGTMEDGGHYYLSADLSVSANITIPKNTTVTLCLNGHKITATSRIFNIQGVFNLCDHTNTGTVTSTATGMAPVFYVRDGAAFNLFGGKLIGTDRARSAVGAVSDSATAAVNGKLNMYGGEMVGATVTAGGGVMELFHHSIVNIYGGTITAGSAVTGSAISMAANSELHVLGGTITGKAGTAASINMVGTMTVGGNAKISGGDVNVYLPEGKTISVGELGENAEVYVTLASGTGVFATDAVETDKDRFHADNGGKITFADGQLSMEVSTEPDPTPDPDTHSHCVCGGLGEIGDHTACTAVTWEPYTGTFEDGKYYYLTEDLKPTARITIAQNTKVYLCLNGFSIQGGTGLDRVLNLNGALTVCDHKLEDGTYKGAITSNYTGTTAKYGAVCYVQNYDGAAFTMFGGNLISYAHLTNNGGLLCTDRAVNLYDVTVSGGSSDKNGGNIALTNAKADVKIYGGTISGGKANVGGNIYANNGKLLLDGVTIEGGTANGSGGSLSLQGANETQILNCTITGGETTGWNGGNIHISGAKVAITGGSISGGKALNAQAGNGGNININGGSFSIDGTAITDGQAVYGGNIAVSVTGCSVANATVSGGTATSGDNIYFKKADGTLTLAGELMLAQNGKVDVYIADGKLNLDNLDTASRVCVSMATPGVFAACADEATATAVAACLRSDLADHGVTVSGAELALTAGAAEIPFHIHCVCAGLGKVGDHTACTEVEWQPWTGTFEDGGYYFLTEDYDLSAQIVVPEGTSLKLCLNGHDIKGASSVNRLLNIYGALTICDHAEGGVYSGDVISNYEGTNTQTGRVFYVQNKAGAALNLFGGNLTATTSGRDGGIGGLTREMNIYAGTVSGGVATRNGGNLILEGGKSTTVLTVYGGTIGSLSTERNTANAGGNIYCKSGKVVLNGGSVLGGIARGSGGSVRIDTDGIFELKSGTISGGKSSEYSGGNLYVSGGSLMVSGGSIENGEALGAAGGLGGNVYINAGSMTVTGGVITGGKAINGGNFAVKVNGASVSGCTVSGGTATLGKDIYFDKADGTLTLSGVIDTLELILDIYAANGTVDTQNLDATTQINITTP